MLTINFQTYHTKIHIQQLLKVKKKINIICTYLPNLNKFKNCAKKN